MENIAFSIKVVHDPHEDNWPWSARIYRIGDDLCSGAVVGKSREQAVANAQTWIRTEESARVATETLHATQSGDLIHGESLRVVE